MKKKFAWMLISIIYTWAGISLVINFNLSNTWSFVVGAWSIVFAIYIADIIKEDI